MYEDVESEQYGTKQQVDHGIYLKNTKANKKNPQLPETYGMQQKQF